MCRLMFGVVSHLVISWLPIAKHNHFDDDIHAVHIIMVVGESCIQHECQECIK